MRCCEEICNDDDTDDDDDGSPVTSINEWFVIHVRAGSYRKLGIGSESNSSCGRVTRREVHSPRSTLDRIVPSRSKQHSTNEPSASRGGIENFNQ